VKKKLVIYIIYISNNIVNHKCGLDCRTVYGCL
jgi:hypothetical protein